MSIRNFLITDTINLADLKNQIWIKIFTDWTTIAKSDKSEADVKQIYDINNRPNIDSVTKTQDVINQLFSYNAVQN